MLRRLKWQNRLVSGVAIESLESYSRLIHATVTEATRRDLIQDARKRRALLLDRDRVVRVLVAEVLDSGGEVTEED